jgi:hypothetical protein
LVVQTSAHAVQHGGHVLAHRGTVGA